mmetsp:Transcript_2322/g.5833  ORF Transcript_2322/g.5833 Transcript_2322/m.5833 type:complete len:268 (-) Transcript_2322:113-916(-)
MVKNAGVAHHRAPPPGLSARLGANLGEEGLCAVGEGIMATPLDPHVMVVVEHVALARRPKQREHGMGRHHSGQQMHAQLLLLRMAYIIRRLLLLRHTVGRRRDVSFPNQLALACLRVIEGLIRGARHLPDGPRIHFLTHPQVRTEQRLADAADALLQRANRTDGFLNQEGFLSVADHIAGIHARAARRLAGDGRSLRSPRMASRPYGLRNRNCRCRISPSTGRHRGSRPVRVWCGTPSRAQLKFDVPLLGNPDPGALDETRLHQHRR